FFFFSSRRRHTRFSRDWSSDVCSSDLVALLPRLVGHARELQQVLEHNAHRGGIANYETSQLAPLRVGELGDLEELRGTRDGAHRSEERRVGKECGSPWARDR